MSIPMGASSFGHNVGYNPTSDLLAKLAAVLVAFLVMQLSIFAFRRRKLHQTFKRMKIDGPEPHFIHGHLYNTRRQAYVTFADDMHRKYGTNVGMYLGGDPFLMTIDLDLIQQVFVAKTRIFYDRMNFYLNVDPVPDNLICQRGDRWRYMRKLLTPAFSTSKIRSNQFYRDAQQTVTKLIDQLERNSELKREEKTTNADHKTLGVRRETFVEDLYDRMAAVALDVIVKTAFHMDNMISFSGPVATRSHLPADFAKGKNVKETSQQRTDVFLDTVKRASRLGFNPLVELIFCFPFLDAFLTFLCNRLYFGSIIKLLFDRLDYLVRRPSDQLELKNSNNTKVENYSAKSANPGHKRRIIDSLIEVLRERRITKSEFTGNAFVIVFAGFETTANALTFTLWLLAKNQQVQQKLRRELRARINQIRSAKPDADREQQQDEELAELATGCEYLEMVINESLRLYPPVPGLSCRQASVNCTLSNGLHIEKGVNIIPSVFSIHRDKSIWGEQADEFKPERFEVLDVNQLNSAMFMPFGLGPRNCIGKAAAMHEMKIVIGRLILEHSVEFCPGVTPENMNICSPINITITSADKIGLKFVKLESD